MSPTQDDTLFRVVFGDTVASHDDPRCVRVPLAALQNPPQQEHWRSSLPVVHGHAEGFGYSENGEVLFAQMWVDESALEDMEAAAFDAYERIAALLNARGYPCLLRTWNYFHDIHRGDGDRERYRQFVSGRYRALAGHAGFEHQLPAATAIGTHSPGMLIYFLAAKSPGEQVENPRQLSAFQYPSQYGPRSPSFSRATRVRSKTHDCLLVSGTASIVGHASRHPGDTAAQLLEIVRNLDALCTSSTGIAWLAESLRVYVRNPSDFSVLAPMLQEHYGTIPSCYQGDICRHDLLVEIEGVFSSRAR